MSMVAISPPAHDSSKTDDIFIDNGLETASQHSLGSQPVSINARNKSTDRASASGHSMSSLTMAMEQMEEARKSFLTDERSDTGAYSSDEENLAAAKLTQTEAEDRTREAEAESGSVLENNPSSDGSNHGNDRLDEDAGWDRDGGTDSMSSSLKDFMGVGAVGSVGSIGAGAGTGRSQLFVQTDTYSVASSVSTSAPLSMGGRGGSTTTQVGGHGLDSPSVAQQAQAQAQEMARAQEKAWQFQGRDLLNIVLDYADSANRSIQGLTAESLASINTNPRRTAHFVHSALAGGRISPNPDRLTQFKLMGLDEDDGEVMDDLPEFGLDSDVLGMGINHFAVLQRSDGEAVLEVRIEERRKARDKALGVCTPPIVIGSGTSNGSAGGSGNGSDMGSLQSSNNGSMHMHKVNPADLRSFTDNGPGGGGGGEDSEAAALRNSRQSTRAQSESMVEGADRGAGAGAGAGGSSRSSTRKSSSSRIRLIVSARAPGKVLWTELKKIRVHNATAGLCTAGLTGDYTNTAVDTDLDSPSAVAAAAALTDGAFRGASNAAEVSALRALISSTIGEITGEPELELSKAPVPPLSHPSHATNCPPRANAGSKDVGDNSLNGALSPGEGSNSGKYDTTWKRVTSFGSGDGDDDSQTVLSETTAQSTYSESDTKDTQEPESFADGGYNDDLAGDEAGLEALEMSMESESAANGTTTTGEGTPSRGFLSRWSMLGHSASKEKEKAQAVDTSNSSSGRNRSASNRSQDSGIFNLDLDMEEEE